MPGRVGANVNRMRLPFAVACALVASTTLGQGVAPSTRAPAVAPARTQAPALAPARAQAPMQAPARTQANPVEGAKVPDAEKLEAAADNLSRIKAALKLVLGRAEQARSEKDVVKLNCVNEKLAQIKALLKVAEQADVALRDSLAVRKGGGEADSSKLAIVRTKVDGLRRNAEQCIGQLAYLIDEKTTIEVEQPSNLAGRERRGLGVANREENPGDSVGDLGSAAGSTPTCAARGAPFCPPPVVRPPDASPSR
jgi:hypothetical protein